MTEITDCTSGFYPQLCGVNVSIDPQTSIVPQGDCILVIGQMSDTATAGAYTVERVLEGTRGALFGIPSMLNAQVDELRDIAPTATVYAYAVPNDFGTAGTAEVAVSGVTTATASGQRYLWVNGQPYVTSFDPTIDTDADVAMRLAALVNAADGLTATAAGAIITITTDYVGEIGGFLDVRDSYTRRDDLVSSSETALAITVTPGTGVPDLSGLSGVRECCAFIVNPYTDSASMDAVSSYTCSTWSGDGCNARAYGVLYADFATSEVWGPLRNNAFLSYQAVNGALTPPYLESASFAGIAYAALNSLSEGIAENVSGEIMPAMLAPEVGDLFTDEEKALLMDAGLGYFNVTANNGVTIGRATTTYRRKNNGSLDNSFIDINAPAICAFFKGDMIQRLTETFVLGNYAFRSDGVVGTRCRTNVLTAAGLRNAIVNIAQRWSDCNLMQDVPGFIETLDVRLPDVTGGCVEIEMAPEKVQPFCCANITIRSR